MLLAPAGRYAPSAAIPATVKDASAVVIEASRMNIAESARRRDRATRPRRRPHRGLRALGRAPAGANTAAVARASAGKASDGRHLPSSFATLPEAEPVGRLAVRCGRARRRGAGRAARSARKSARRELGLSPATVFERRAGARGGSRGRAGRRAARRPRARTRRRGRRRPASRRHGTGSTSRSPR